MLVLVGTIVVVAATAIAGPTSVGSLVGSKNATLDGQAPLPHTTMLSGDNLQVNDGLAIVALDQGNRMILGHGTEASFSREAGEVTVSLARGNVLMYHPEEGSVFRVKIGDVTVTPEQGSRALGELAMSDGLLVVTAKDGVLQVKKAGSMQEVSKGKTITIAESAADAPTQMRQGRRHLKHLIHVSPADLFYLGLGAEAGSTAWAIVEASSGAAPAVSPIAPGP